MSWRSIRRCPRGDRYASKPPLAAARTHCPSPYVRTGVTLRFGLSLASCPSALVDPPRKLIDVHEKKPCEVS